MMQRVRMNNYSTYLLKAVDWLWLFTADQDNGIEGNSSKSSSQIGSNQMNRTQGIQGEMVYSCDWFGIFFIDLTQVPFHSGSHQQFKQPLLHVARWFVSHLPISKHERLMILLSHLPPPPQPLLPVAMIRFFPYIVMMVSFFLRGNPVPGCMKGSLRKAERNLWLPRIPVRPENRIFSLAPAKEF